jgi:SAM-dependent methyltransferase
MSMVGSGFRCRACGSGEAGQTREVPERMFQTGDDFPYAECARCGAWSLAQVPADLDRHYPAAYPAFAGCAPAPAQAWREGWFDTGAAAPARLVAALVPDRNRRILDVGAGSGRLLRDLAQAGYRRLHGVDPHLPENAAREMPFVLRRGTIADCPGGWDVIMYHHVLEHVPAPDEELLRAAERLAPGGRMIVRVPLADSWARRRYDTCWLQWDAPRHLWLPTRAAIRLLSARAGLSLVREIDDSRGIQVWASRLYQRGLTPSRDLDVYPRRRQFMAMLPLLAASRCWARMLNLLRRGDQAAFVLEKPL